MDADRRPDTDDAAACGYAFAELVRRHGQDVDDDLQSLLTWARAIGRPPEDGPFRVDDVGRRRQPAITTPAGTACCNCTTADAGNHYRSCGRIGWRRSNC